MKTRRQILEQEWYKKTDTPFTDQTADHLQYALDAMEVYAAQFFEGGEKPHSIMPDIISESGANGGCESCYRGSLIHGDDWICSQHAIPTD